MEIYVEGTHLKHLTKIHQTNTFVYNKWFPWETKKLIQFFQLCIRAWKQEKEQ